MYPIQLNLKRKHIVIVGGGKIAWRKLQKLKGEDCTIDIVSPTFDSLFLNADLPAHIQCFSKQYEAKDIALADLIIIATNDKDVNDRVRLDAKRHQWVNHTGDRSQSDFFNMKTVAFDGVTFNISSDGESIQKTQYYAEKLEAFLKSLEGDYDAKN
ncbi:precorrin-2 dehydrogenase/sirohydrochlorin ferrochelatase family protein [Staphylococcus canis]|uniref:precorrin-2 dehydrogenase n=1 Tax=Staphylococcus canis TaxID=2724942 RepID=A0ABS0T6G8_9STAP|nr:bifunctional precorrin-2 dehydrogenase/sirohydrochlorin ferrochelatase [Staphylococcus canis]MBI5974341.1 bifunctional precorrin-2 dehydrogenase/sirohydrochlorin ferrochelatase [Staphylococcus canis]